MVCRGVRGATTVTSNSRQEILRETRRLLALMIRLNGIEPEDVASAIFTTTSDVNAEFPALAARQLAGGMQRCCAGMRWMCPTACPTASASWCIGTPTKSPQTFNMSMWARR